MKYNLSFQNGNIKMQMKQNTWKDVIDRINLKVHKSRRLIETFNINKNNFIVTLNAIIF